ncbi:ATP-binding protein, partial [Thermoproteota archaeon]
CFIAAKANSSEIALTGWKIALTGGVFISTAFYNTACIFCNIKRKKLLKLAYMLDLIFVAIIFLKMELLLEGWNIFFGKLYYPKATMFYCFALAGWFAIAILGLYELWKFLKVAKGIKYIQAVYFFIGTFLGFTGGVSVHFPFLGLSVYPLGNLGVTIYALLVTYAILRYRLMDISIAITRTGVFVATYSLVLGIPFIMAYCMRPYLVGMLGGDNWWLGPMGLLTVLATAGPFIYIFFNSKAEARLLREQRSYQSTLRHASSGMIRIRELSKLLNLIVHVVTKTVKIEFAAVSLMDPENNHYTIVAKRGKSEIPRDHALHVESPLIKRLYSINQPIVYDEIQLQSQEAPNNLLLADLEKQLKELGAAVVIPSFVSDKMLGFIVLGRKLSGKMYSQDDLNVFLVLANQAALAIENAQFYEDVKNTQEQLFQAEKMATIGTMADGLSHQINNRFQALSLIAGDSLDILRTTDMSNSSPEVKESFRSLQHAFDRIQANVMQGGEVVKGLLRYSRPGPTGFDSVDFYQVINGALEMAQYKVRLKELDIEKIIPNTLPNLKCNLTQLQEVFFNLVDNAYDAIKERQSFLKDPNFKGRIEISAAHEDANVHIIFKDNGIGVKNKDKDNLFTPFFTTKATNKKGTGLGLYVIQKIIHHHTGTVSIDSTYNVGTTFEIVLPLVSG